MNQWRPPRWVRLWTVCATRGGDGWLWYALAFNALLFGGAKGRIATAAAAVACGAGIAIFLALKRMFRRKRPCAIAAHCWATLLPPDQFSFPSGHTITAFSVAVPFAMVYPALAVVLFACALSVAISRSALHALPERRGRGRRDRCPPRVLERGFHPVVRSSADICSVDHAVVMQPRLQTRHAMRLQNLEAPRHGSGDRDRPRLHGCRRDAGPLPGFFASVEATSTLPGGNQLHVGVYDIDERQHSAIQALRDDIESLVAYLRERDLFFAVNHAFCALTGARCAAD